MARTPLFSTLKRALFLARRARERKVSPKEIAQEYRDVWRHNRRRFLELSGAAAAAVTAAPLAACREPSIPEGKGSPLIAIVGGGVAGLTAAYRLRTWLASEGEIGVGADIYEASTRTGGRMWSHRGWPDGQVAELGGELVDSDHEIMFALAEEFGIPMEDRFAADAEVTPEVFYFDQRLVSEDEVIEAFMAVLPAIDEAYAALNDPEGDIWYADANGAVPGSAAEDVSLTEWLERNGFAGTFIAKLLEVAYVIEYGLPADDTSVWNMLYLIGTEPNTFEAFGTSDERYHVAGGNDQIVSALADAVSDRINLGYALVAMSEREDGRYELVFDGVPDPVVAGHVILTLPFTKLREVDLSGMSETFKDWKLRSINEIGYGMNAKLMVGFRERVWRTQHGASGNTFADLANLQATWETSGPQAGNHGIMTNFTGGELALAVEARSLEDETSLFLQDFDRIFPGSADAAAGQSSVRFHWSSYQWTHGSYSAYRAGQWVGIGGAEQARQGNVHFAGEHCGGWFQGYMNGGAQSGEDAAAEVLTDLGLAHRIGASSTGLRLRSRRPRRMLFGPRVTRTPRRELFQLGGFRRAGSKR